MISWGKASSPGSRMKRRIAWMQLPGVTESNGTRRVDVAAPRAWNWSPGGGLLLTSRGTHSYGRHEGYVYVAGENGTPMTARSGIPGWSPCWSHSHRSDRCPDPQAANGAMDAELVDRLCRSAAKLTPLLDIRQGARLVHSQVRRRCPHVSPTTHCTGVLPAH
jgi:hypothetical protein